MTDRDAAAAGAMPQKTPMPWGLYVVGALGGLLFGFDTGVISGAGPIVQSDWGLDAAQLGFITASVLIGSMVGALSAGRLSDRFGRKKLFVVSAIVFIVGGIGLMSPRTSRPCRSSASSSASPSAPHPR